MAIQEGEDVYASLLLTDTYLPGALVLAHSLRDAGTRKKLAILVTPDTVSVDVIRQLETVYDYVIPVSRIRNGRPENLYLMDRPDLHSAFTKIELWRQTQFRKIVYIDADVVAYRAPDELFHLPHVFSAAPDIGWPDLFNTGVMVLTPNLDEYKTLKSMAERGVSFDGADQGLLNMHFKNSYNRLSFTYNVTPSAHYQYVPAYKHHQKNINLIHFIGAEKPWIQGRGQQTGSGPYNEMIGKWWAVYDRHYRSETSKNGKSVPEIVQYFVKGEYNPTTRYVVPIGNQHSVTSTASSWDAQRQPPPAGSRPEALNLPQKHYEMSSDVKPFIAPDRYPSPPEGYNAPKGHDNPNAVFPWENSQPPPTRVFAHDQTPQPQPKVEERKSVPNTPPAPATREAPPAPTGIWSSFPRTNAWDEIPQINRYVDAIQTHRRTRSQGLGLSPPRQKSPGHTEKDAIRVTDFPSEDDRPSLPVTPAPIRRPKFWGGAGAEGQGEGNQQLPVAEGVPPQAEWDPVAQLQKLAQQQHSNALLQKLGAADAQRDEIPSRPLPFGSEDAKSPTYVSPSVVSPKPVKPVGLSDATKILTAAPEIPSTSEDWQSSSPTSATSTAPTLISLPAYQGPGAMFEKGEDYPTYETPALPTEEDRDILET